jgi:gamma-glutamyl-gamma-aminobutyrate hydrolase PuuD
MSTNIKRRASQKIFIISHERYDLPFARYGEFEFDAQKFIKDPKQFRLVVLTGGEDINPGLYGQRTIEEVKNVNIIRDSREVYLATLAIANRIPIVGICRGAQLLNVMGGGSLIQHCDNHNYWHKMTVVGGKSITVSSTHHQMMVPPPNARMLGWSTKRESTIYKTSKRRTNKPTMETEVVFLPKIFALAVQYHPEYMKDSSGGSKFFHWAIQKYLKIQTVPRRVRSPYVNLPKPLLTKEIAEKEEDRVLAMGEKEQAQYNWDMMTKDQKDASIRHYMSLLYEEPEAEDLAEEDMETFLEGWSLSCKHQQDEEETSEEETSDDIKVVTREQTILAAGNEATKDAID